VDRFIARNAEAVSLSPATLAEMRAQTAEDVITRLCGSVRSGYYAEFAARNRNVRRRDLPLDSAADAL
jgi:hypothetical protein